MSILDVELLLLQYYGFTGTRLEEAVTTGVGFATGAWLQVGTGGSGNDAGGRGYVRGRAWHDRAQGICGISERG